MFSGWRIESEPHIPHPAILPRKRGAQISAHKRRGTEPGREPETRVKGQVARVREEQWLKISPDPSLKKRGVNDKPFVSVRQGYYVFYGIRTTPLVDLYPGTT